MKSHPYRELLASLTPIIFDGAMGTQIQQLGVREEDFAGHNGCNEILTLTRPEVITEIHKAYLRAGANVIETNSFGANRIKLSDYALDKKTYEINVTAASLARKAVAEACCSHACLVCGTMGPTGILLATTSASASRSTPEAAANAQPRTFDRISEIYGEQAAALVDGGVDLLLLETAQDLLEMRAAIVGIKRMLAARSIEIPLQVHATVDASGRMLMGADIMAFLGAAGNMGCDAVGLNCSTGPHEMEQWARELCAQSNLPVAMMPNAGMPKNKDGKAVYDMDSREFGQILANMVTGSGLAVVGGCCGTTPEHIRVLSDLLRGKKCTPRTGAPKTFVATGISGTDLESGKRPLMIGERLNTQGSKKTKELVLAQNWDELYQIALQQMQKGCRLLDLCVATNERDGDAERGTMQSLVSFLSERVTVPFCIDTTEEAVFASALRACPGSALINSINLEHGGAKARAILPLAKEFGCPVIALTIDDEGMAKTVARKVDVARRIVDLACGQFGLPLHFVYIDPLTFTLATGDGESADAAKNSLEALFRLKEEMPRIRTAMGVSNVSYGLKPASRRVLNNLMLHYAAQAGLDAAIFNPLHLDAIEAYDPAVRILGENLLFNRKPEALADYINAFDDSKARPPQTTSAAVAVSLTLEQDLHNRIVDRDRRDLAALIDALLKTHEAQDILNTILLPAMALVGDKMNKGEMILPFVLQAAEIMKEAVAILEPKMAGKKGATRGKIVLATVYGDVHDIGKNLVATILKNQGYEIIDCGRQVPTEEIIAVVKRENPDAVGLSALLVTTSREMARFVAELDRLGMAVPVLIGGAAVNRDFAARIARVDSERGRIYAGGVHYAKDAFEAIRVLDTLGRKESGRGQPKQVPLQTAESATKSAESSPKSIEHPEIVHPHFYGTSQVLRWDAETLLAGIDTQRLFKGYFGGGKLDEKVFLESREKEFVPVFEELKKEIVAQKLLDATGLYGIFPVYADDQRLFILDPDDFHTQRAEFIMPRIGRKQNRSIADYFRPEGDTIGIQIVTIGKAIDEQCRGYFGDQSRYSRGFYLNAIANYLTEQLAEKVSIEIRRALLIPSNRGRRYSFGYPGLPGVQDQAALFDILAVEERLGVTLTPGFQMVPEHSTMGIFVHHPDAEYL